MRTTQGDQAISSGCAGEAPTQKGLIGQIGPQHHPTRTMTDQRDAPSRRLVLKLAHEGIDAIEKATPAEAPAGCQPIQLGGSHDAHRSSGGVLNPISEWAIRLPGDQKATENDNGLGKTGRAAGQDQIVLIT